MSWSRQGGRSGPRGYHHGNLKEALIRAALELIAQEGAGRLHLRGGGALGGGQSGGALPAFPRPRRAAGRRGAARLRSVRGRCLAAAWDGGRPDVFAAFDRVRQGLSANSPRTEPAYYSAMFEAGIPPEANPELREAGDRAFAVLRTADRAAVGDDAGAGSSAGPDDGAAHLGDVARHRRAVRPRRCRPRARCRCRPKTCWRRRCWSICAAWACTVPATGSRSAFRLA